MKGIYYILIILLSFNSFGQVPQKMNYQMVVTDLNNQILSNQAVGIKISVIQGSISGTAVYAEIHTLITNPDGLVNFNVGGGTVVLGSFATIDWMNGPYFLKSETDPLGGNNYSITTTSELLSTPYTLFAGNGFGKTSLIGDTLFYGNGQFILIPDISSANPPVYPGVACDLTGILNPALNYNTVMDIDGNTYKTIIIGTQEWMAENLRTTRYRNGDNIHHIVDQTHWKEMTEGAWCYFENNNSNKCPFGNLYNAYAVEDSRNICPVGWHIPSDSEVVVLKNYLGPNAGGKVKSVSQACWWAPNTGATNSSGFSAVAGQSRGIEFINVIPISSCSIWTSGPATIANTQNCFYMQSFNDLIWMDSETILYGLSVRCIKD